MRFSMLYSGEQILSFKPCLLFYTGDSLRVELGLVHNIHWVWDHVKCLGHDTSVRQHYKSEH